MPGPSLKLPSHCSSKSHTQIRSWLRFTTYIRPSLLIASA